MENKPSTITTPAAIIIAGALIAVSIIWINKPTSQTKDQPSQLAQAAKQEIGIRSISSSDHILGNPNAKIKIIEYSDTACPFCKVFNATMVKIINEYGPSGKVAWIYRHYPLDKADESGYILHKNAGTEAQALECAASLGGNTTFWDYEKALYEKTPSVTQATPNGLDPAELPKIAKQVGLNVEEFKSCLSSGKFKSKVEADYLDGVNAGINGTPFSIIITPSGSKIPLSGARDYQVIKNAIDAMLVEAGS